MGRFFVLDGMDGCGKTTQSQRLVQRLQEETGQEVLHLREPGSTPVGESLRALLLNSEVHLLPEVEVLLFLIELTFLNGRAGLDGREVLSVVKY